MSVLLAPLRGSRPSRAPAHHRRSTSAGAVWPPPRLLPSTAARKIGHAPAMLLARAHATRPRTAGGCCPSGRGRDLLLPVAVDLLQRRVASPAAARRRRQVHRARRLAPGRSLRLARRWFMASSTARSLTAAQQFDQSPGSSVATSSPFAMVLRPALAAEASACGPGRMACGRGRAARSPPRSNRKKAVHAGGGRGPSAADARRRPEEAGRTGAAGAARDRLRRRSRPRRGCCPSSGAMRSTSVEPRGASTESRWTAGWERSLTSGSSTAACIALDAHGQPASRRRPRWNSTTCAASAARLVGAAPRRRAAVGPGEGTACR